MCNLIIFFNLVVILVLIKTILNNLLPFIIFFTDQFVRLRSSLWRFGRVYLSFLRCIKSGGRKSSMWQKLSIFSKGQTAIVFLLEIAWTVFMTSAIPYSKQNHQFHQNFWAYVLFSYLLVCLCP